MKVVAIIVLLMLSVPAHAEMITVVCLGFEMLGESAPCVDAWSVSTGDAEIFKEATRNRKALNVYLSEGWKILEMKEGGLGRDDRKITLHR